MLENMQFPIWWFPHFSLHSHFCHIVFINRVFRKFVFTPLKFPAPMISGQEKLCSDILISSLGIRLLVFCTTLSVILKL